MKANTSDTQAALLDLHLSFSNDIVSTKRGTYIKVRVLRGYFGPLWSQNLKVAFHKFLLTGLLEE